MAKDGKTTIRKKLSNRDYARLLNYLQYGNDNLDLSEYCPEFLSKIEIKVMRLTEDEKRRMDEFLSKIPTGISIESFLDSIPKIKKTTEVEQVKVEHSNVQKQKKEDSPKIGTEHPRWVLQTVKPMTKDSIDVVAMIEDVEQGKWTAKNILEYLRNNIETPKSNEAGYIMCEGIETFSGNIPEKYYIAKDSLYRTLEDAGKRFEELKKRLDEPEPTEEETFERYKKALTNNIQPVVKDLDIIDEQVKFAVGNKITFDLDGELFEFQYDNKDDMQNDLIFLEKRGKINSSIQVDIFGKKTTIDKILHKIYKKSPDRMPDGRKFYKTFKEAYEAGEISV